MHVGKIFMPSLCHLRRRLHHRGNNIWGTLPFLLVYHWRLVDLCRLVRRLYHRYLLDLVDLWVRLVLYHHPCLRPLKDLLGQVCHLDHLDLFRLVVVQYLERLCQGHLGVHLLLVVLDRPVDLGGQLDLVDHLCLDHRLCRYLHFCRFHLVDLLDQVGQVGMGCKVVGSEFDNIPVEPCQGIQDYQGCQVCQVYLVYQVFLVDQPVQVGNNLRKNLLVFYEWSCCCDEQLEK